MSSWSSRRTSSARGPRPSYGSPTGARYGPTGTPAVTASDENQPRIGEEIAGARALNELAMKLLTKAHDEIDEASGRTSRSIALG